VVDLKEGAHFKLRIRTKKIKTPQGEKSVPNYDYSEFSTSTPDGSDEYIETLEKQLLALKTIIEDNGTRYKSYEQLANRLAGVEGFATRDEAPVERSANPAVEPEGDESEDSFFARLRGEA